MRTEIIFCWIENAILFFYTGGAYRLAEPTALHSSLFLLHHRGRSIKGQWGKDHGTWCFILRAEHGGWPDQPAEPWVEVRYYSFMQKHTRVLCVMCMILHHVHCEWCARVYVALQSSWSSIWSVPSCCPQRYTQRWPGSKKANSTHQDLLNKVSHILQAHNRQKQPTILMQKRSHFILVSY